MNKPMRLNTNAAATYRSIDAVGRTAAADPHQLVELMYKECVAALRAAAFAAEKKQPTVKSERISRAPSARGRLPHGPHCVECVPHRTELGSA
jgi:flagellar protein FliS